MKRILLILSLILLSEYCVAQTYKLEFTLSMYDYSYNGCTEYDELVYDNNLQDFSSLNNLVYTAPDKSAGYAIFRGEIPSTITFSLYAIENFLYNCNNEWSETRTINLYVTPNTNCGEDEVTEQISYTGLLLNSVITPVIDVPALSITTLSACADETMSITTSEGFGGYIWEVYDGNTYFEFRKTSVNSTTFSLMESFPSTYSDYLGKPLYFRVRPLECNYFSSFSKSVTIYPPLAKPNSIVASEPKCSEGSGFITLSNFVLSGKKYEVDEGNLRVNYVGSENIPTDFKYVTSDPYIIPDLLPGKYTISISNGVCVDNFEVTVPPAPSAITYTSSPIITPSTCVGQPATVSVTAEKGNGDYTYTLFGGANTVTNKTGSFTIGTAGTYYIEATDKYNCTPARTSNFEIKIPAAISFTNTVKAPSGHGKSDGQISVIVDSPNKDFIYEYQLVDVRGWQTGSSFTGLADGQYWVQVRTNLNCVSETKQATLIAPKQLSLTIDKVTHVTCMDGSNGSIEVSGEEGTPGYVYSLYSDFRVLNTNGIFPNLAAGKYTIYVRDSNKNTASTEVTILPGAIISVAIAKTNVSCSDLADGTITVTASGGTAAYTYSLDGVSFQSSNIFTNRGAGNYTISVKDKNGCTASAPVTINKPGPVSVEVKSTKDAACQGSATGSVTLAASGGTGTGYQFSVNGTDYQTSSSFNGLPGGDYMATLKDSNGCTASTPFKIEEPTVGLLLTEDSSLRKNISCFNGRDGVIVVSSSGGTGTVRYLISTSPIENTTGEFTGLAAGKHVITAIDDNKCSKTIEVELTQPSAVAFIATVQHVSCFSGSDGHITITATGGTGAYTYSIDNGATFQSSNTFNSRSAGTYSIVVKDINNCRQSGTATVNQPLNLASEVLSSRNISCYGGSDGQLQVKATGGTSPYSYSINGGAAVNTTGLFVGLPAGDYLVTVKDAKGCEHMLSQTLTEPSQPLSAAFNQVPPAYAGASNGEVSVLTNGGTEPYTFAINGGAPQTSNKFTNLSAGSYTFTVTDVRRCKWEQTMFLDEPSALTVTVTIQQRISCNGAKDGVLAVAVEGGVAPYVFSLNGGEAVSNSVFGNLGAGTYNIRVTDGNGASATKAINLIEPTRITVAYQQVSTSCNGGADGKIELRASGGTGALRYSLNGVDFQSSNIFEGLRQGNYTIYVRDEERCTAQTVATVNQPSALLINATLKNPVCFNECSGEIALAVQGGTGPYTFTWLDKSELGNNPTISNLCSGVYRVLVTDAAGCSIEQQFELYNPEEIVLAGIQDTVLCKGQQMLFYAGSSGSQYLWSADNGFSSTQSSVTLSQAGNYQVKVTNEAGCSVTKAFTVTVSNSLLKADFLMASVANAGDTLFVVDISKPTPANTEWITPQGATIVGSNASGTIKQVVFEAPGTYTTQMKVNLGECADVIEKTITILPKGQTAEVKDALGYREELIKKFMLYPNPTSGYFSVLTEVSQKQDITLQLIDFNQNKVVEVRQEKDSYEYTSVFNHPELAPGVYILTLKVGKEVRTLKVVKI